MFYLKVGVTITTQRKIESNAKFELSFSDNGFSFTGDCVSVDDNSINVAAIANDSYTCVKDLTKNSVLFNLGYPVDINFVLWFFFSFVMLNVVCKLVLKIQVMLLKMPRFQ